MEKKSSSFFFYGKNINGLKKQPNENLKSNFEDIIEGKFIFFNNLKINLGLGYDWVTNPITKYRYNVKKHWSLIKNYNRDAGDIKYVWEKSRFTFLFDIIRFDYHHNIDQSELVFNQIEDFIDKNPINKGPNYICSQEISLRIFNWTFALYFYKDSKYLNEKLFSKTMNSIYWQIHHVYNNINFSRFSVRNNHVSLKLYCCFYHINYFHFFLTQKSGVKKAN